MRLSPGKPINAHRLTNLVRNVFRDCERCACLETNSSPGRFTRALRLSEIFPESRWKRLSMEDATGVSRLTPPPLRIVLGQRSLHSKDGLFPTAIVPWHRY
jgi:hypothetical protein